MKKQKDPQKVLAAKVRAFKLSPRRRRQIAMKAIRARWAKTPKGSKARSAAGFKAWATRRASPGYVSGFRTLAATESHRDRMTRRKQGRSNRGRKKEGT